jgi:glucose/mannose transport system substrate-binding protein
MLDCQNADHSALSWDQAVRAVIQGKAAFTAMGDWTYGELAKAGLKEDQDFGWVSSPRHRGRLFGGGRRLYFGKGCAAPG